MSRKIGFASSSCSVGAKPIFGKSCQVYFYETNGRSHKYPICSTDEKQNPPSSRRRKRPSRAPSAFERTLEDLTMKRLGRGSMYYGPRPETPTQDADVGQEDDDILKPNPILVTGATGRTGLWITLGLSNQQFNVRVFTRSFGRAEKLFGPSGANIDVFEGNVSNFQQVLDAVDGSVAIVCASGSPRWLPGGFRNVDVAGVKNLIDAAKQVGTISRFVLISSTETKDGRGAAKREAEDIVCQSGLPYVIVRTGGLSDAQGGVTEIIIKSDRDEEVSSLRSGRISRIDLAQVVCQALVYGRSVAMLNDENPEADFDFPSCIITAANGNKPFVVDGRFWKKEFNRISDDYREKTGHIEQS